MGGKGGDTNERRVDVVMSPCSHGAWGGQMGGEAPPERVRMKLGGSTEGER